jgi:predicted small lipoprotein YifL
VSIHFRPLAAALALGFTASAAAQQAHEHGVADLRVALEGSTLLVEFESPLANLVGFEHVARSDAERKAIADLDKRLRAPAGLLGLPAAAGCSLKEVELELPGADDHAHHDHGHDHAKKHDHGHKHDQAGAHDHKHHGHAHGDEHADAYVAWEFACKSAAALDAVEVKLIQAFPAIRVLRAETASPRGQAASRIEQPAARLPL